MNSRKLLHYLRRASGFSALRTGRPSRAISSVVIGVSSAAAGYLLWANRDCLLNHSFWSGIVVADAAKAKKEKEDDEESDPLQALTAREQRFLSFASLEFNNQVYMTPRDFLDSVTQERPRSRHRRRALTESEVKNILKQTPLRKDGTTRFFRDLDENGIISYTEYLFLLCVLTKPRSGFTIAFNMFDMDGNQRVDKQEFLVIQALMLMLRRSGKAKKFDNHLKELTERTSQLMWEQNRLNLRKDVELDLAEIFGRSRRGAAQQQNGENGESQDDGKEGSGDEEPVKLEQGRSIWDPDQEKAREVPEAQDTTILVHLFGPRGRQALSFDDFFKFYENLQSEVLELEFNEFSKGKPTISEMDFAKILLRYTIVHSDDYHAYLRRVEERIPEQKGVNFSEFLEFCKFLNNLDDFSIAVKLYTFANRPISQAEFERAVKISTGRSLNSHVVNTVFQIFDVDGDGHLSYGEFIAVMKDRFHRGFRSHLVKHHVGWSAFKHCVRDEMRSY